MKTNSFKNTDVFFKAEKLFVRALTAWLIASFIIALNSGEIMTKKEFLQSENPALSILLTVVSFAVLNALFFAINRLRFKRFDYESIALLLSAGVYFSYCVMFDSDVYLTIAFCAIISLCCVYAVDRNAKTFPSKDIGKKSAKNMVAVFMIASLCVLLSVGVFRCLTFSAPNYDLGIFANTAYNLKTKFIQYNTCERDALITHFQVHVSPILYVVTPFYLLFPSAVTLQVIQAAVVASSVIPVYFICKKRAFSNKLTLALCFIAVFFSALSTGTFYDFHENAFLPAFILWMIYFYEAKKNVPMFVFAALTLCVKEDASVYVAFFGLYLMTRKSDRLRGFVLTSASVGYVLVCIWFINKYGFGAMTGRFKEYITDERLGLISLAANAVLSPAYVVKNCMNEEKLGFILQVMAPFLFMPFVTKKYSRFILLGPFLLMNLMPAYKYQHSIYFQYLFGVIPLLIYLSVINAGELSHNAKIRVISCCICVTTICYCSFVIPKTYYVSKYFESTDDYKTITGILDEIPEDASVSAPAFYVAYLANRDVIYENEYTNKQTEYIVFDLRYEQDRDEEMKVDFEKYKLVDRCNNLVAVYKTRTEG